MNRLNFRIDSLVSIWLVLGLGVLCGCQGGAPAGGMPVVADSSTAQEILSSVLEIYQNADTYRDQAVLYLSYRLEGRAIQEPHRWHVAWDRRGRYSADIFGARIRCDGRQLSCYVFDIESANIGNQHLMIPADTFSRLLDDPIASYFIFGANTLPVDERETQTAPSLLPPTINFIDSGLSSILSGADSIRCLDDDRSLGKLCRVIELQFGPRQYVIWVDQATGMLEQIRLPLQYLDSQILASDQVSELQFRVRFHDAVLNATLSDKQFEIPERSGAVAVQQFVPLPEPLPCQRTGEIAGELRFHQSSDNEIVEWRWGPGPASLMWISAGDSIEWIPLYGRFANDPRYRNFRFGVVYADDLLRSPGTDSYAVEPETQAALSNSGLTSWFDKNLQVSSEIGLTTVPAIVVFDRNGGIQYVQTMDDPQWSEHFETALARVGNGEPLADEIRAEYQRVLDDYHRQLVAVAADVSAPDSKRGNNFVAPRFSLQLDWETSALQKPGNIHLAEEGQTLVVLDGWQTIVELDLKGNILRTVGLDLPQDAAINRIRSGRDRAGRVLYAAYSLLGKQVFVFDQDWERIAVFPVSDTGGAMAGITECLLQRKQDGELELWLSTMGPQGIQRFDWVTGESETVADGPCQGFVRLAEQLWLVRNRQVFQNDQLVTGLEDWKITRLHALPNPSSIFLALGSNSAENWQLFGIGNQAAVSWSLPISSQRFNNDIDAISVASMDGKPILSLVGRNSTSVEGDMTLTLIECGTERITLLGRAKLDGSPAGLATLFFDGVFKIVISEGKRLSMWTLQNGTPQGNLIPDSDTQQRGFLN